MAIFLPISVRDERFKFDSCDIFRNISRFILFCYNNIRNGEFPFTHGHAGMRACARLRAYKAVPPYRSCGGARSALSADAPKQNFEIDPIFSSSRVCTTSLLACHRRRSRGRRRRRGLLAHGPRRPRRRSVERNPLKSLFFDSQTSSGAKWLSSSLSENTFIDSLIDKLTV